MSKALLLVNCGNRDLGVNGVPLFDNKYNEKSDKSDKSDELKKYIEKKYKEKEGEELTYKGIYEFTKKIYESALYKELNLEPIIIKNKVKKILEYHNSIDIRIFGTLQNEIFPTDSFYTANIIEYLLKKEFKDKINNIKVNAITDNPSDYSLMFDYYFKVLSDLKNNNYDKIYLGVTGGTSALSYGLITQGVLKWESNVEILYKPPNSEEPVNLDIGNKVFKVLKNKEYNTLKDKHLYGICAELGKEYNIIPNWEYYYLKGLNYKKMFNFKKALNEFEKALNCENISFKERDKIQKEIKLINCFKNANLGDMCINENLELYVKLISLLIENAIIKWENGEYVDFIGRVFRIEEAILRMIIEKEYNISTNKDNKTKTYPEFEKFLKENKEIIEYLKRNKWNETCVPNIKILSWIFEYNVKEVKNKNWVKKYGKIYNFIINLEKLSDLRNKSILAHGFIGVSEENILEKYNESNNNKNKLIEDLNEIKEIINKL